MKLLSHERSVAQEDSLMVTKCSVGEGSLEPTMESLIVDLLGNGHVIIGLCSQGSLDCGMDNDQLKKGRPNPSPAITVPSEATPSRKS